MRNRTRIVEAARAALAESHLVRLNEIAKRAGVGEGALYRNFPNREALLAEVYRRDVEELVAAASALLVEHEPVEALRHWLDRVIGYAAIKCGVLAALEPVAWQDDPRRSPPTGRVHGPSGRGAACRLTRGLTGRPRPRTVRGRCVKTVRTMVNR
ncbi:TetR/AcrR family transcriptional regulator [Streptomyces malaysiensis]|uniref:HTH tetR-type domain-containing protein n=1 Tax=Streptomyces malaysiensis TaxID=92644 RepID=A0A7X6ATT9_STRMQ|nr:helix-turn-helix domain-containing protein [Streptomyces malaysiensis]NIY62514.1 hypothetical protein [Streptomyces malaysiensis]